MPYQSCMLDDVLHDVLLDVLQRYDALPWFVHGFAPATVT